MDAFSDLISAVSKTKLPTVVDWYTATDSAISGHFWKHPLIRRLTMSNDCGRFCMPDFFFFTDLTFRFLAFRTALVITVVDDSPGLRFTTIGIGNSRLVTPDQTSLIRSILSGQLIPPCEFSIAAVVSTDVLLCVCLFYCCLLVSGALQLSLSILFWRLIIWFFLVPMVCTFL